MRDGFLMIKEGVILCVRVCVCVVRACWWGGG